VFTQATSIEDEENGLIDPSSGELLVPEGLTAFWAEHPAAETPLRAWRAIVRKRRYQTPNEVRADFGSVDFLKNGVTVFNVGGNKYRLSVTIRYDMQKVFIRHLMTHEEYDRRTKEGTL
jgi:mRNA interferase HigB